MHIAMPPSWPNFTSFSRPSICYKYFKTPAPCVRLVVASKYAYFVIPVKVGTTTYLEEPLRSTNILLDIPLRQYAIRPRYTACPLPYIPVPQHNAKVGSSTWWRWSTGTTEKYWVGESITRWTQITVPTNHGTRSCINTSPAWCCNARPGTKLVRFNLQAYRCLRSLVACTGNQQSYR